MTLMHTPRTGTHVFTPQFLSRTTGIPYTTVSGLESPLTADWSRRVLHVEAELQRVCDRLKPMLEAAIGGNEDQDNRRDLLNLRRSVHNMRMPSARDRARAAVAGHDEALGQELDRWIELCAEYGAVLAEGPQAVDADEENAFGYLANLVRLPEVRNALVLASPELERQLEAFAATPADKRHKKRARRQLRTLLSYAYRSACKTSPFSTFTSVSIGQFDEDASGVMEAAGELAMSTRVRLNVAILPRVVEALRAHPWYSRDLPMTLVDGWEVRAERLRYMRRHRITGAGDQKITLDRMQESIFYLAAGEVLGHLIELLQGGSTLTLAQIEQQLTERLALQASREDVQRFLQAILRLDLLVTPQLAVDIHSDDPFRTFADGLHSLGTQWADQLAERILHVDAMSKAFAEQAADQRHATLRELRQQVVELLESLGANERAVPGTLLYEDATTPALQPRASATIWNEQIAHNLARFARILPVFDVLVPQRLLLKGFFTVRFGRSGVCRDFIRFVQDFHMDIFDEYMKSNVPTNEAQPDGLPAPAPNWLDMPELDDIHAARVELVHSMRRAYGAHRPEDGEMVLDDAFFDGIIEHLPSLGGSDPDPRSFFVQVAGGEQPRVVMNQTYTGLGLMFSRFLHLLDDPEHPVHTSALIEHLQGLQPEGAVFAEMTGGVDTSNLNLHPSLTAYEIVCPGEVSSRHPDEQIPASELEVHHDAASDQIYLWSPRLGKRVIPVYLGYLVPLMLPDVQRVLLLFSLNRMAQVDMWTGTDAPLGNRVIASHPRVRYGDLIIVRETWKTNPAKLPQRRSHSSTDAWYLSWQRFRHEHGLPRFLFATLAAGGAEETEDSDEPTVAGMGSTKPQYVDLESLSSLRLLDDMVRSGSPRLVFQEMLPAPDQLWHDSNGELHVSEQTIEITFLPEGDA